MPLSRLRALFGRSPRMPLAANDSQWDLGPSANLYGDVLSDSETVTLRIDDFDLHQRDLGADTAEELQRQVLQRLKDELSHNEALTSRPNGVFELTVQDAEKVDTEKLADHLIDSVLSETFSLNRCLIECELSADY